MSAIVKLDTALVQNRLGFRDELEREGYKPEYTPGYRGIYAGGDFREIPAAKQELVVNAKLSIPLDCSIELRTGSDPYHALVVPNPRLYEAAEVSCAGLILPGTGRVRPVIHLRGLKKFDLSELDWLASIHLLD